MGRSGSTLIYDAVAKGLARKKYGRFASSLERTVKATAWNLDQSCLIGGVVYKTHDFPYNLNSNIPVKAVFLFGSASEAAISVYSCRDRYGSEWVKTHLEHLRAVGQFDEILERDVLRFKEQIETWTNESRFDVLALRYESLWNYEQLLSDFLGFQVHLPPRRSRSNQYFDFDLVKQARRVYANLDRYIETLPDAFRSPISAPTDTPTSNGHLNER